MKFRCIQDTKVINVGIIFSKEQTVPIDGITKGKFYDGGIVNLYARSSSDQVNVRLVEIFNDDKKWVSISLEYFEPAD